ncbi:MAG: hypothetical protein ACOY4I_11220 [Bacillota bacterium]
MTSTALLLLAVIGIIIAAVILFKGKKLFLACLVGIMSIMLFVSGLSGYKEIKRDAGIYQPLAAQWLEAQIAGNPGAKAGEVNITFSDSKNILRNYSVYCIYYPPDNTKAVVYVELPSSNDDLVMAFNRNNKKLEEIHYIPKKMKPELNWQNKLEPSIFFY